jgi:hypothetical protein
MTSKNKNTLCLSDVKALNKMQRELAEKKVDISLYLAFGFKQLFGENSASPSEQGKWLDSGLSCFGTHLIARKLIHLILCVKHSNCIDSEQLVLHITEL